MFFNERVLWPVKNMLRRLMPGRSLSFEVNCADHCNLDCWGCDHGSPLAREGYLDIDGYAGDLKRLSGLFHGRMGEIRLCGGEPLLNPRLHEIAEITRSHFPHGDVTIITNGILLARQEKAFWESIVGSNTGISVTVYPGMEENFKKISETGALYGAAVKPLYREKKESYFMPFDTAGKQNARLSSYSCFQAYNCATLSNGRLFPCSIAPTSRFFSEYFNIPLTLSDKDSVDIHTATAREILSFVTRPIPFCRYCAVGKRKWGIPWSRSQKDVSEWTARP
jgi:hypothetical protein